MMQNYITVAWRNLLKNKAISFIMIFGLAASIAAFLLITQYVFSEFSYDEFHTGADNIYRIRLDDYKQGVLTNSSVISYHAEATAIKETFPEVENFVRLHRADGMISYRKPSGELVSYHEKKAFYADSSLFDVFSFPLLKGAANQVLRRPESVVISESMAQKYFGRQNPIGKTLRLSSDWQGGDYVVEGVFADIPMNSHIHFDFVFSIQNLLKNQQFATGGWYWTNFYTYLLLKPGTLPEALENRLSGVIEKHIGKQLKKYKVRQAFALQPFRSIHLHSQTASEVEPNGKIGIVYVLILVAFLILAIGWLNYINLSTARGIERAKEVGLRKALGSEKRQLIQQFFVESLGFNLLSVFIGIGLFLLALVIFSDWIQTTNGFSMLLNPLFWIVSLTVIFLGFFLSAFYPAFVLSSFKPIAILKGYLPKQTGGESFRKSLVVFQFTASIFLIIATLVINQQLAFMQQQDLGMNINQQLIIKAPKVLRTDSFTNDIRFFKDRMLAHTDVRHVTASSEVPGQEIFWTDEWQRFHQAAADYKLCSMMAVDEDFIPTYNIKLLAGRNFNKELVLDNEAVIINESALKAFGFATAEQAINQEIGNVIPKKIVGVVNDFHQQSLKTANRPIIFQHIPWNSSFLTIALRSNHVGESIAMLEKVYHEAFPGNAFEFFFLDDHFQQQYKSDERVAALFSWFALVAISIACLGLLGLAMFTAKNRTKEIGIRKVLGASVGSVVMLLSRDFLRPVGLAILLASPLAWYAMTWWLQDFAYKTDIKLWTFLVAGVLAIGIALVTVSFQSVKAALTNPVKSLRGE
ncbi:ABC transporter permease [Dyadobacter chenwenxiniae]|uniref:ABC transporter permease n=1 Tax=Dyadobacter chenwenxiniae TaxID=2906456 RepID=A0A9X1PIT8_9BACT|nr:ABC transporter permease [Dyadobacter chenwenxiniae]MCF0060228.1 ABC transporter permease [Dyadobacter chenwenxiniae]UON85965.1 ABC transporter permease [Dyadobacter chenwenxiniae]